MALSGGRQVSHDWWRDVCCDKRHSSFSTFPTRSNAAHSPHIYVVRRASGTHFSDKRRSALGTFRILLCETFRVQKLLHNAKANDLSD